MVDLVTYYFHFLLSYVPNILEPVPVLEALMFPGSFSLAISPRSSR